MGCGFGCGHALADEDEDDWVDEEDEDEWGSD